MPLSATVPTQPGSSSRSAEAGHRPAPAGGAGAWRVPPLAHLAALGGTAALLAGVALRLKAGLDAGTTATAAVPHLYLLLALAAAVGAWDVSRRPALPPALRRAWALLALACSIAALRAVLLLGIATGGVEAAAPLERLVALGADALSYGLGFAAVLHFLLGGRRRVDRTTFLLDVAIVGVAAAAVGWQVELQAVLLLRGVAAWQALLTLANAVLGLAMLVGFAVLLLQRPERGTALPLRLLGLAALLIVGSDALHTQLLLRGGTLDPEAAFLARAVAGWLTMVAAVAQLRLVCTAASPGTAAAADASTAAGEAASRGPAPAALHQAGVSPLPYLAKALLFVVLLLEAHHLERHGRPLLALRDANGVGAPLTVLVLAATVLALLTMARQLAVQRHNRLLVADRLASEAYHRALVQHASDVILVLDAAGHVRDAGPGVAPALGRAPAALVGRPLVELIDEADRARAAEELAAVVRASPADARPPAGPPREWRLRHADGSLRWFEIVYTNLLHEGAVGGVVVNARDVSERKTLEAELTHQAFHDSLTGLLNRARFTAAVDGALARMPASDDERSRLAVLYVDLDDFKPVNDRHGHEVGDRVLAAVAERLRDATRGSDTVARLGGDEFAVLLERVRSEEEARMVADRVVRMLGAPLAVGDATVTVGGSVGVAVMERGATARAAESLLREADGAMYEAKAHGGRQYRLRRADAPAALTPS